MKPKPTVSVSKTMDKIQTKNEPLELESGMDIYSDSDGWTIQVGGGQQPHYNIKAETLQEAITRLVVETVRDAIEDEARQWSES